MTYLLRSPPRPLTGAEPVGTHQVEDFWRWAFSDMVTNTLRGVFAEWLVATALGVAGGLREEWAAHDLTLDGVSVEVKSTAYIQSWAQRTRSRPSFSIARARAWDANTGIYEAEFRRQADVYVFCLLGADGKDRVDPLDTAEWRFYVLPTAVLDSRVPGQKRLALSSLLALAPIDATYADLRDAVLVAAGVGTRRAGPED